MMWSDRCRWSRATKSAVSCFFAFAVIAVVLPYTLPPERAAGGVQLVSADSTAVELLGPERDEEDKDGYEVYIHSAVKPPSIIVEPTPTPTPVFVYCNDGGKYYHGAKCRYTKRSSARVTLGTALNAGFNQCKDCDAPAETLG